MTNRAANTYRAILITLLALAEAYRNTGRT